MPEGPHTLDALATRLRLPHRPTHRAVADVATTADLLGYLVNQAERGAATAGAGQTLRGPFEADRAAA